MDRARTIDVIWFNERGYPHACFEVEHKTDIQNSLIKYVELQDFRINFNIVASAARRKEFESKLDYSAFSQIRDGVHFIDYDNLSNLHAKVAETAVLTSVIGI
ncbi:MAG TPA: hypothetical protein VFA07_12765 [Chthonomonadaceae bacterium]|nr:hypothetical protein [Chthonomonadaceae bacterium]